MASLITALDEIKQEIEAGIRSAASETVGSIASRQGKFSGQLRASNNLGVNAPDLSEITVSNYVRNSISGTASLAKSNADRAASGFKLGGSLHLSNAKDYAVFDEYKHGRLAYESGADEFPNVLRNNVVFK